MSTARVVGNEGYRHEIELASGHKVTFDEPESAGGTDLGPAPSEMLAAALAACTAITLRMYAARKEWDMDGLGVDVERVPGESGPASYRVALTLPPHLDDEQHRRLRVIAGKCPVHRDLAEIAQVEVV